MPYYKQLDLLFIHIPKTGGTSMENYLKGKAPQTLFTGRPKNNILPIKNVSLQHQTYKTIKTHQNVLGINFDSPKFRTISIVRNPYERIVSDLFYFRLINKKTPTIKVTDIIKKYINSTRFDNHNIPQYNFLTLNNTDIAPEIHIFRTETLKKDATNFGLKNFNASTNKGMCDKKKYYSYLNDESIRLINVFYKKDFELFGYEMKKI